MEFRFQHIILTSLAFVSITVWSDEKKIPENLNLDNEFFELGISGGFLAIQDFNTESSIGVNATFHASENFFLQLNYFQADASLSSIEENLGQFFQGSDRRYSQYDLSVGYNIFQGELYPSEAKSTLSTLFVTAGAGNLSFGGEDNFVTSVGIGYKLGLSRRFSVKIDFRNYVYQSNLITQDSRTQHNTHFTTGIAFLL